MAPFQGAGGDEPRPYEKPAEKRAGVMRAYSSTPSRAPSISSK